MTKTFLRREQMLIGEIKVGENIILEVVAGSKKFEIPDV